MKLYGSVITGAVVYHMAGCVLSQSIPDSQDSAAPPFIGNAVDGQLLKPKVRFVPDAAGVHMDMGNTRSDDFPGPLGESTRVFSNTVPLAFMFWDGPDNLVAELSCDGPNNNIPTNFCLAALDHETLEPLAIWTTPNRTMVSNYMQYKDNHAVLPTLEGYIVDVERVGNSFKVAREIDISSTLPSGSIIASVGYAADGNLWFTATPAPLIGIEGMNTSTIGYVDQSGAVHTIKIANGLIENSFALNNGTLYVATGPAGLEDHAGATGNFYAFRAGGANEGIRIMYNETYSAGDGRKPGGLSRGTGSTPSLLGSKYVAITDNNADLNLVVYRQVDESYEPSAGSSTVCTIRIFPPGAGSNEAALTTHYDGEKYTAVIANNYNAPSLSFLNSATDINNAASNNFSQMAPGLVRIDVSEDGACSVGWELEIRIGTSTLSTITGLLYVYTQDNDLAKQGEYVWYIAAIDHATGKEVWRVKVGAGGVFNSGVSHMQLAPGGAVYQGVVGGAAWVKDIV
ncbi:hypothetical protein B0O99DRAFT_686857 [Bisporella sp. PMI_857]|nr:hypothetical protein B0O99DRAFT_686857 [Bisporella sp. PMI_857]